MRSSKLATKSPTKHDDGEMKQINEQAAWPAIRAFRSWCEKSKYENMQMLKYGIVKMNK